jgi:nucleotide-binding universal stress UspA family protein
VDVIVCGTRGEGAIDRVLLGSTATSLLHHLERPLLVVPAATRTDPDGPLLAGFDESDASRGALRFAASHLRARRIVVAHAWRSPIRHSLRGHAFAASHIAALERHADELDALARATALDVAEAGSAYGRELGLDTEPSAPESGHGDSHALLEGAKAANASAILVGSRGLGAVTATVLGSVASGLVHAAELPVIVVAGA